MKSALAIAALALALADCGGASAGSGLMPAGPNAFAARTPAPAQRDYRVVRFSYHVMPLRHSDRSATQATPYDVIYPDDLTDYGGPIMKTEAAYNIYVNCSAYAACWGGVETWQHKLTGSAFAGLLTQYTKSAPSSLTLAGSTNASIEIYPGVALYENDLFAILHGVVAKVKQNRYKTLYHIFLPKGVDTCFDFSRSCYSPDYRPTNNFCAYHGTVQYSDLGLVVYSVEPYQDEGFCKTDKSAGASELTNSTISTLAHETFEAITDPGPALAWFNKIDGEEMADECEYYVSSVTLGGTVYNIQPMYSNAAHGCATK